MAVVYLLLAFFCKKGVGRVIWRSEPPPHCTQRFFLESNDKAIHGRSSDSFHLPAAFPHELLRIHAVALSSCWQVFMKHTAAGLFRILT